MAKQQSKPQAQAPKQNQQRQAQAPKQNIQNQQRQKATPEDYDNTDKGSLFVNNRKKDEKQPDLSGNINCAGTDFWLSGWNKVDSDGLKYVSLSANEKDDGLGKMFGRLDSNMTKTEDKHPDMRGTLIFNGEKINIAGWFHSSKQNKKEKFISLAISTGGQNFDESTEEMPWDF